MLFAPTALLEGVILEIDTGSSPPHNYTEVFVSRCQKLDREVHAIHHLARVGTLPTEDAERQLNTYLLAAVAPTGDPKSLILPLADAPQPGMLPDLGHMIHRVMARDPIQCCLSVVIEQCIPSLRHTTRSISFTDSQDVILNMVMGMLLGLYPDNTKKPGFRVRAQLYCQMHCLLTSSKETQTEFCKNNEEVIILACMEYIARIVPVYMPVQALMLTSKDSPTAGFYRRIPGLCDELRQSLDEAVDERPAACWELVRTICSGKVAKVSRLKRVPVLTSQREAAACSNNTGNTSSSVGGMQDDVYRYLEVPRLHAATTDEFKLLASGLNLKPSLLQLIQTEVQISPLPRNLLEVQWLALQELAGSSQRKAYLRSRRYLCIHCLLTHAAKTSPMATLRLDTLQQRLVCATCLKHELVCVNLLGRILSFRKQQYYLCPQCMTVQQYRASGEQVWVDCCIPSGHSCMHTIQEAKGSGGPKRKPACFLCFEPSATQTVERVDHLTGELVLFHYCQRHAPRLDTVAKCSNARQLAGIGPPPSRIRHASSAKAGGI
jgi:hypothetical protein